MEIEIKITSTEIIKSSSPTPKSLRKYQLSLLDQFPPPTFVSFVYFFSTNLKIPNFQKSNHLKKSLSETLSTYYPLAGRFTAGNLYVECNDGGVPFSEAEANCNLSQIVLDPNKFLNKLFPHSIIESQDFCAAVQATYFRCGGLALGILVSHKIADALSFVYFVNSWSSVARIGDLGTVPIPKFDTAADFPPQDMLPELDVAKEIMMNEDLTTRTITFPARQISILQEIYSGRGNWRPSRVEALSAYLWSQFLAATSTQRNPNKIYQFLHPMNLRNRIDKLPTSQYRFGNVIAMSMTKTSVRDSGFEVCKKIRQDNDGVYDSYMALMKNATEKRTNMFGEITTGADLCFSSICGLPIYEADFGWGKPIWVGLPGPPLGDLVFFMDAKTGGDIDAIIRLSKQNMEKLEAHLKSQPLLNSNL